MILRINDTRRLNLNLVKDLELTNKNQHIPAVTNPVEAPRNPSLSGAVPQCKSLEVGRITADGVTLYAVRNYNEELSPNQWQNEGGFITALYNSICEAWEKGEKAYDLEKNVSLLRSKELEETLDI